MKNIIKNVGILTCLALLFLFVSQVFAPWRYNPFTRKLDYYSIEVGGAIVGEAAGDVLYYNGTNWTNLPAGANTEVLTLVAGVPSWAADIQFEDIYHTGFISTDYYDCGNSGASITIDWNNGNIQHITLTAVGVDITFTEPPHPGHCELWIIQDGTGDRTIDWEHEISPKWPGNVEPTLSTGIGDIDVVAFTFIGGTTYRGLFNGNFE